MRRDGASSSDLPNRTVESERVNAPRLLLDTNVWNYIVESDGVEQIRRAAKVSRVAIIACPAVVYECLRVADSALRSKRGKALARDAWTRVMPEAYSEAEDLRREMQRLRPEWFLKAPDLRRWHQIRADWQSAFWRRVRREPTVVARRIAQLGDDRLKLARSEAKEARNNAESYGHTVHTFKWNRATGSFAVPTPGWDGREFEAWRASSVASWWQDLVLGESPTARDWLEPWLDLPGIRADQASWTRFWTREVSAPAVPREWIRWAMAEVQATRATSRGTPGDNQLATYLLDVDLFVTNDKVFAELVEAMRPHCPARLSMVKRSPSGDEALAFVLDLLQRLRWTE